MRLVIPSCLLLGLLLTLESRCRQNSRNDNLAALDTIHSFRGVDFEKLRAADEKWFLKHVATLLPDRSYGEDVFFDYHPRIVWRCSRGVTLLVESDRFNEHPGYTRLRTTVLDPAGTPIGTTEFTTGWRCYLESVRLGVVAESELPLIVLNTTHWGGPDVVRQFYAPVGERYELVRLENDDATASRNRYFVRHFRCGPTVPRRSEAEWVADILSEDRARVLRALVWLGGEHWKIQPGDKPDPQHERRAEIALVQRVRANPHVIVRVKELCGSSDHWLREAALLAGNPDDQRF